MIKSLATIVYERVLEDHFTFNHGCLATNYNDVPIIIMHCHLDVCMAQTQHIHMHIIQHEVKAGKDGAEEVTGSYSHVLKVPTHIVGAHVDLAGRAQGQRLMSVCHTLEAILFPVVLNLELSLVVFSIGKDISTNKYLSREVLLLPLA